MEGGAAVAPFFTRFFSCTERCLLVISIYCGFKPNRLGVSPTHDASEIIICSSL